MKLFEVVGNIRNFTKKFSLVRKLIDFFPPLRNFDQTAFFYSRIKAEELKIISYLSSSPRPKIRLVCDLSCTPPTYGDFAAFLMSIRILSKKFEVTFVIVINGLTPDWENLGYEEQKKRLKNLMDLARSVAFASDSRLVIMESFDELLAGEVDSKTIFSDYVKRRKKIYWDLKYLNDLLFVQLGCNQNDLLDRVQFAEIKVQALQPYILWHIRRNFIWVQNEDLNDKQFLEFYRQLRKVIGRKINIVICSSDDGLREICEVASMNSLEIRSARENSFSFLGDLTLLSNSLFFLQIGGGGMSEFAWCSSVPFLDFDYPIPKTNVTRKKLLKVNLKSGIATSWQNPNQFLSLHSQKKEIDFEPQLLLLFEKLEELKHLATEEN